MHRIHGTYDISTIIYLHFTIQINQMIVPNVGINIYHIWILTRQPSCNLTGETVKPNLLPLGQLVFDGFDETVADLCDVNQALSDFLHHFQPWIISGKGMCMYVKKNDGKHTHLCKNRKPPDENMFENKNWILFLDVIGSTSFEV